MRMTRKVAAQLIDVLEDLRQELPSKPRSGDWESKRVVVKERLRKLPDLVEKAAGMIQIVPGPGRPHTADLAKRTMLFLFARLMQKSNRDMEDLLVLFGPLFHLDVSYKSIERLYSDEDVKMVLHNLFLLLLQEEGVSGHTAGDGTGYGMSVTRHYSSDPRKHGRTYRYAFRLIDLQTGMYVGVGFSLQSEMEAFHEAMEMARPRGIKSIRLDRYYSSLKVLHKLAGMEIFVIPKKNLSRIGLPWARLLNRIASNPLAYLLEYFQRNLSENGFSSDKARFGWMVHQKREDRQRTALFSIAVLHNLFYVRATG